MTEVDRVYKNRYQSRDVVGAVVLIFLGIILLLNNFDWLPANFWLYIFRFWPLILILMGLQAILGGSLYGDILVMILSLGTVYLILAWALKLPLPNEIERWGGKIPRQDWHQFDLRRNSG